MRNETGVRAVVYGVGAMGSLLTRQLLEKGVEIVGAVGRSPEKVGRDLGVVAGLDHELGVAITDDAETLLATCGADIAVVAVGSTLAAMAPHFRACLAAGVDVITLEEEALYPWHTAPHIAAELDALGRAHGTTLAASGMQDVHWCLTVGAIMASAQRIARVRGRSTWMPDEYGPEVAQACYVGWDPDTAAEAAVDEGWGLTARATLEAVAALSGLVPTGCSIRAVPIVAEQDVRAERLRTTIPRGSTLGMSEVVRVTTAEHIDLELEMAGYVHRPGERPVNEWSIEGEPTLYVRCDDFPGRVVTCATLVNRIPDVLAGPPGLVTIDRLPLPRYRPGPLVHPAPGRRR